MGTQQHHYKPVWGCWRESRWATIRTRPPEPSACARAGGTPWRRSSGCAPGTGRCDGAKQTALVISDREIQLIHPTQHLLHHQHSLSLAAIGWRIRYPTQAAASCQTVSSINISPMLCMRCSEWRLYIDISSTDRWSCGNKQNQSVINSIQTCAASV